MKFPFKLAIVYVLQAVLVLVPLTWISFTSELFEMPKMLLTYAGAVIIGGLWVGRMIQEQKILFRRTPFELPLLLFLLSQLLSTLFSIDPHTSIFGYYSRLNGGLLSLFSYALIYFAAVSNFDRSDAVVIIRTLVITAVVSSLYAFPEHFGHSPSCLIISGEFHAKCWVQNVQDRVFGTFGQPNWLAAYLVVVLPITIFSSVFTQHIKQRLIYAVMSLLILSTILFTKSQSGIGATAAVLLISFIIISIQLKRKILILSLIPLSLLIFTTKQNTVLKTLNSLNYINPFYSTTPAIVAHDMIARGNGGTDSMVIRRIVWEGAWKLALKNPLFGTGVETFAYSYYNVRPAEHNLVSEWDFLYNKAHNEFLNYAANTGFIGLGTYLLFLGSYIAWSLKNKPSAFSFYNPALLSGFLALNISNFFGFSTVPVNTLLFLFPALGLLMTIEPAQVNVKNLIQSKKAANQSSSPTMQQNLGYWTTAGVCFVLLYRIAVSLTADITYANGKSAADSGNYSEAAKNLQDAAKMVPDEPLYTEELSLTAAEVAANLHANEKIKEASQAASIALALSDRTIQMNPVNLNFYKTRAKMFIALSSIDPRYGVQAGITLDQAIKLAPTDAKLWFNRALLTYQLGFKEESLKVYQKTMELKLDYGLAKQNYVKALVSLGKTNEAQQVAK